jgi:hypothetical protein
VNPFQSLREYEEFVYTLRERFPAIERSTLVAIPRGKRVAIVQGEITFAHGYRITIKERLSFDAEAVVIESYAYELWRGADKIGWYDSQPHPDDPLLQSTHPHHKHVSPDIKHNRTVAPEMSFTYPNLPALIHEVETSIARREK